MKEYCMIETAFSNKDEAIKTVETLLEEKLVHSYDCFEMAIFDLDSCDEEYLNWIREETITKESK